MFSDYGNLTKKIKYNKQLNPKQVQLSLHQLSDFRALAFSCYLPNCAIRASSYTYRYNSMKL